MIFEYVPSGFDKGISAEALRSIHPFQQRLRIVLGWRERPEDSDRPQDVDLTIWDLSVLSADATNASHRVARFIGRLVYPTTPDSR